MTNLKDKLQKHLESKPLLVDSLYYDIQAENYPDSDRYYTDAEEYNHALDEGIADLIKIACEATGLQEIEVVET